MLVLSCLVAVAAALQPSQMLSTRSAQVAQRTPAPEMKRPDYFLRVSRSEAGRPRLCVFRWAFAATTGPRVGRVVLVSCTLALGISDADARSAEQLSFRQAGALAPPPSQLQTRPSQRTPVQPSGGQAQGHS